MGSMVGSPSPDTAVSSAGTPARGPFDPADPRMRAWRAFLYAHAAVMRELEAQLVAERGMTLAEYDALVQLAGAPARDLRMSDLASRVLLSRSGVTRLVDRLERQGLVRREHCGSDARGAFAALTTAGVHRLREAMPVHLRGIDQVFGDVIGEEEALAVERAMAAVAAASGHPFPDDVRVVGRPRARARQMTDDVSIGQAVDDALAAYEELAALAETVEDEWTYVTDLAGAWRGRLEAVAAERGGEPAGATEQAAVEGAIDEVGRIRDPHRAIDWLSTFPQVVLSALGEQP